MFTTTFALDCHIEELRAELLATTSVEEARCIRAELEEMVQTRDELMKRGDLAVF